MSTITRLGFGVSGPLGQRWFSDRKTASLVEAAIAGGIRRFDTAPFYFDAEARLGKALASLGARDVFISTKTGTRRTRRGLEKNFSEGAIRADVEQSLARLRRDRIDLLYLHGPTVAQIDATAPVLAALKREGKIKSAGVCGEGAALAHAVEAGCDAIMAVYNLLDRRHETIFQKSNAKGVMTVAIAPLAQGVFDPKLFRPSTPSDIWRLLRAGLRGRYRAADIQTVREAMGEAPPAATALAFVLANPDIDLVMTTTTKLGHLAQSLAAARQPIDQRLYEDLKGLSLDPPGAGA